MMIWFCFPNLNASTIVRSVVKIGIKHSAVNTKLWFWLNLIGKVMSPLFRSYSWAVLTPPVHREEGEGIGGLYTIPLLPSWTKCFYILGEEIFCENNFCGRSRLEIWKKINTQIMGKVSEVPTGGVLWKSCS